MTTLTPDRAPDRADVQQMFTIHRVFRREFTALPTLTRGVAPGDVRRAGVVAQHADLVLGGLHLHHTGEDEVLWPLLLGRAAPSTGLVETMQAQHERVDAHVGAVVPALAAWRVGAGADDREQVAGLLEDLATSLLEHLEVEEREVVPLIARHITAREWDRLGEHGREAMTPRQLALLFGAILEDASRQEAAGMLGALPVPARLLLRTVGLRQYRRHISRVRGR